jgi:phosphinothricin acetyltransferase
MHALLSRICTENEASLRMCERLGFENVGVLREVGCKFGRRLDVAMLELLL